MKPIWQLLQPDQLGDTLEDLRNALGGFTARMALDLQRILSNGATFKDNLATAYIEFDAIHGTEMPVANPFRSVPQAFIPISAFTLVGGVGGRNNGVQLAMAGQPVLNLSRTDGFLGITVQYAPPLGAISMIRAGALNQANGNVLVPWDTPSYSIGSGISYSAGTSLFTFSANGVVRGDFSVGWVSAAGVTRKEIFMSDPGFTTIFGINGTNVSSVGGEQGDSSAASFPVAVGSVVGCYTSHDNAGALQVIVGSNRTRTSFQYVAPDPATTARVRGILVEA